MKAREGLSCPACGALNRPTWEFCVRCGESLEEARQYVREAEAEEAAAAEEAPPRETLPAGMVGLLAALVLSLVAVAAWQSASSTAAPSGPDPGLFTMATQPAAPPTPPPTEERPGSERYRQGVRRLLSGDPAVAAGLLREAVGAEPDSPEYRSALAQALWQSGERERALSEHKEAARLDPRRLIQYARALDMAGQAEAAAQQYEEVLARTPAHAPAHEDLGRLFFRSGQHAKAVPHLEQAVQARPDDPVLRQELAYALDRSGDKARAAETYFSVLAKAPGASVSRGLLAETLFTQGRRDEALGVIRQGLERDGEAPLLLRQLGSLLERTGSRSEAAAAYRQYTRLAPNAPDAKDLTARAARLEPAEKEP